MKKQVHTRDYADDSGATKRVILTPASAIVPRRQRWFWKPEGNGVIPLGVGTIFAGKGGEGKSTFALHLAAQLSRGTLPGDLSSAANTIIIGPEDAWDTVMVPRLIAAGADLDRIFAIHLETVTETYSGERSLAFPLDTVMVANAIEDIDAKLLLIDPAPSLMSGDMNKVQDVRASYEPLISIAQQREMALILINHFGKGGGSVSAKLSGSHAWRDLTRSYLAFATDEESGERVITQDKGNYSPGLSSYAFTLEGVNVPTEGGDADVARVKFLGVTDKSVGEIINRETDGDDSGSAREEAAEWLLAFLDREPFEFLRADVIKAAKAEGYSESTLKRAKDFAGVTHGRTREVPSKTIWIHPKIVSDQSVQTVQGAYVCEPSELTEPTVNSKGFSPELTGTLLQSVQSAHPHEHEPTREPTSNCTRHQHPSEECDECQKFVKEGDAA